MTQHPRANASSIGHLHEIIQHICNMSHLHTLFEEGIGNA